MGAPILLIGAMPNITEIHEGLGQLKIIVRVNLAEDDYDESQQNEYCNRDKAGEQHE